VKLGLPIVFQNFKKCKESATKTTLPMSLTLWRLWMACQFGSCQYVSKKEKEKVPQRPIHVIDVLFVQKGKYF